jgi:hypothetical protein
VTRNRLWLPSVNISTIANRVSLSSFKTLREA